MKMKKVVHSDDSGSHMSTDGQQIALNAGDRRTGMAGQRQIAGKDQQGRYQHKTTALNIV